MINSKNYIAFILPYFTIVCGLYHFIYYSFFDLDGLSLISVGDIIKGAVKPVIFTFLFAALGALIAHKLFDNINKKNNKENTRKSFYEVLLAILFYIIFYSLVIFPLYFFTGIIYFPLIAFAIGNIILLFVDCNKIVGEGIGELFNKEFLVSLLIYFPCISVANAFQDALNIQENKSFKYSVVKNFKSNDSVPTFDTLKLVGVIGENFLFTDLGNEKVFFIKSDSMVLQKK